MSVNKFIGIGRLTRDPEFKDLQNGPLSKFGLAFNEVWNDSSGEKQERTTFLDCVLFGKSAETFNKYTKKGDQVYVEGTLRQENWEGQDGEKRSSIVVKVNNFQFLESANKKDTTQPVTNSKNQTKPQYNKSQNQASNKSFVNQKNEEEEMPF